MKKKTKKKFEEYKEEYKFKLKKYEEMFGDNDRVHWYRIVAGLEAELGSKLFNLHEDNMRCFPQEVIAEKMKERGHYGGTAPKNRSMNDWANKIYPHLLERLNEEFKRYSELLLRK